MDNVRSRINSASTSRDSYNKLKVTPDSKCSFIGFLTILRQSNKACELARTRFEADKAEIINTYSKQEADKRIPEITEKYVVQVKTNKEKLYERFNEIMTGKRSSIEKYVLISPPDELVKLLQTYQFRIQAGGKINDTEWNMLVRRVSDSGNYQAMQMLHDMGIGIDRDFPLPFNVDDRLSELDNAEKMITPVIEKIDAPANEWGYWHFALLSDSSNKTKEWLDKLDTDLGMSVAEHQQTWVERLKASAQMALHAGNFDLFNKTYAFIAENRDQLMTAAEAEQDVRDRAEQIIAECMEAGKNEK